jgi:hypothetical protein
VTGHSRTADAIEDCIRSYVIVPKDTITNVPEPKEGETVESAIKQLPDGVGVWCPACRQYVRVTLDGQDRPRYALHYPATEASESKSPAIDTN